MTGQRGAFHSFITGSFCGKPLRKEQQEMKRKRKKRSPGFGSKVTPMAMREDRVPDTPSTRVHCSRPPGLPRGLDRGFHAI